MMYIPSSNFAGLFSSNFQRFIAVREFEVAHLEAAKKVEAGKYNKYKAKIHAKLRLLLARCGKERGGPSPMGRGEYIVLKRSMKGLFRKKKAAKITIHDHSTEIGRLTKVISNLQKVYKDYLLVDIGRFV